MVLPLKKIGRLRFPNLNIDWEIRQIEKDISELSVGFIDTETKKDIARLKAQKRRLQRKKDMF